MAVYDKNGQPLSTVYDKNGQPLTRAYDKDGNVIFNSSEHYPDYNDYTITDYASLSNANTQALAIYYPYMIQFRGSSSISNIANLYNLESKTAIKTGMSIQSNHGNTASFSNDFYAQGDVMPLLYVSSDVDRPTLRAPTSVTVHRVTETDATLVKTILFDHPETSYWGYAVFDFENEIAYTVGLTGESYTSDLNGTNKTIITKWDISNVADGGYATYVSHVIRDFIYVMQGMQYRNGIIWISSGYSDSAHPQMVYGINPNSGNTMYTITTGISYEIEGIDFLDDYNMIIGFMGGRYKLCTFAER